MNRATEIVSGYFEMYVTDHYDTNPFQYSVISSAFESVFLEMKIDSTIMMPIIFTNILNEYYGLASKFINDESVFDIQDANDVAKCVVVLIQEGYPNTLKYTKEQFLVFFEFLFRFGVDGIRFDAAQQFLLEGLKNDNLSDIYNIIFKYFDPISSLLPSIFLKKNRKDPQELANYLNFVRFSNAKILAIEDSTKYSTIYSKNILAALYNIEVFGFNEGLSEGICELIQRVDIKMLTGNHLFMKVFEESKRLGSALSSCADSILSRIINDEFLGELSMDPNFFFKSIFLGFLIKDLNYSSYTLGLSQQSMKILDEINMQCSKYHWAIKLFSKFNTLEAEFINMSAPELVDLCKDVSELTKFLPVCFEVKTVQANSAIGKLIGILTNLISASIRDTADPNLNIERYKTFVKLLEFSTSIEMIHYKTESVYPKVLLFYIANLTRVQLDDVHESIMKIFENLTKSNHFLRTMSQRKFVYDYLKAAVGLSRADNVLNELFFKMLQVKINKPYGVIDTFGAARFLKVSLDQAISCLFFAVIKKYLSGSTHIPIEVYDRGVLPMLAYPIIKSEILSTTELLIAKAVFDRYSQEINLPI